MDPIDASVSKKAIASWHFQLWTLPTIYSLFRLRSDVVLAQEKAAGACMGYFHPIKRVSFLRSDILNMRNWKEIRRRLRTQSLNLINTFDSFYQLLIVLTTYQLLRQLLSNKLWTFWCCNSWCRHLEIQEPIFFARWRWKSGISPKRAFKL